MINLLPLRWKGTRDQWWYASPVDLGHFDVVRELLSLDPNNLIDLTSRRRIHRLNSFWRSKDDDDRFAKCRSLVARELLLELDLRAERASMSNVNAMVSSGYGGWLTYTAASAGDAAFITEMLDRNPLLVFGEGEYVLIDILSVIYAVGQKCWNNFSYWSLDGGTKMLEQLCNGEVLDLEDMINVGNNEGRTALHLVISGKLHPRFVEILTNVPSIDVNLLDWNGKTPLDVLSRLPRSALVNVMTKRLVEIGGVSGVPKISDRKVWSGEVKMNEDGSSSGAASDIPDSKIFS